MLNNTLVKEILSYKNEQDETIYLFDIERAILDIEQVRQCRVVVSEIDGKRVHVAHIVLPSDTDVAQTLQKVKEHCSGKLDRNHIPTLLKIHDSSLPVGKSGKLDVLKMENDVTDLVSL